MNMTETLAKLTLSFAKNINELPTKVVHAPSVRVVDDGTLSSALGHLKVSAGNVMASESMARVSMQSFTLWVGRAIERGASQRQLMAAAMSGGLSEASARVKVSRARASLGCPLRASGAGRPTKVSANAKELASRMVELFPDMDKKELASLLREAAKAVEA